MSTKCVSCASFLDAIVCTTQLDAAVRIRAADISDVRRVAGKFNAAAANLVDERCKSPFADTPARARVWFTTYL